MSEFKQKLYDYLQNALRHLDDEEMVHLCIAIYDRCADKEAIDNHIAKRHALEVEQYLEWVKGKDSEVQDE